MTYHIDYAYTCHAGKVRPNNEDNFWCCGEHLPVSNHGTEEIRTGIRLRESLPVMAVFDGMGGESQGEMAAWLASDSLEHFYRENKGMLRKAPELFLTEACKNMNQAVCDYGREQRIDPPTCILYPDDYAAMGGINEIRERGLRIPEDISVAGYDGINIAQVLEPKLTTLCQDTAAIGKIAAERLIELIEHPKTTVIEKYTVDGTLFKGASVKTLYPSKNFK